jgi:3-hydroxyacyl-CoA dehydrogenase/enoyl-CoA hydratase/3-hydroxybutyryl-CoA epimerase
VSLPVAPVVLRDVSVPALARASKRLYEGLDRRRRSRAISPAERDRQWFSLSVTTATRELAGADLVIEAVFEDLELKRRVLAECEAVMSDDAIFASNTSALPIGDIAKGAARPARVLGMHYFSPVPKMPLVEIVVPSGAAREPVDRARAFAVAQGKTPIVVADGPGFYTTRILSPYLNEAVLLLEEGAAVEALDRALVDFGFLVGPATLLDEVGIDVGAHVTKELGPLFTARGTPPSESLARLVAADHLGKKNGRGFYRRTSGKKEPNAAIYALLGGAPRRAIPERDMAERCVLAMVNEAVHALGDGAIRSARDGDVGAILGLGFPPFRGGPFRYVDALGAPVVGERLRSLASKHGPRFAPAPLLAERVKDERRFTDA